MKRKSLRLWALLALLFGMGCQITFSATGGGFILLIVAAGCLVFVMLYGSGWIR